MKRAVFLDRDGVLNVYLPGDYVKSPDELVLLPGIPEAVRRLNDADFPIYLISNQRGVARGLMTDADLRAVDDALREQLAEVAGATIGMSYYCTDAHGPRRKPEPGMLLHAADEHGIDLAASVFVGDTETDSRAARAAGVGAFVLVLTGKLRDADSLDVPPDFIAADLGAAVDWILHGR